MSNPERLGAVSRKLVSNGRSRVARTLVALGALMMFAAGCASDPKPLEPLPRHPFPQWVSELEVGKSDLESVTHRFGEPDGIEQSVRGGLIYRYHFAEVRWPDDDPDRPVVGANGVLERRPDTKLQKMGNPITAFGRWLDWLMFYPPKQPRPARQRWLPATVHDLELQFDLEGKLARFRYAPEAGRAPIPAGV